MPKERWVGSVGDALPHALGGAAMKMTFALVLGSTLILSSFGVPGGVLALREEGAADRCPSVGVVVETDVQCSKPCRLVVTSSSETHVDRGLLASLDPSQEVRGTFRFWDERAGRVLYVYDDAQNLLCRVTNPDSVTVLEVLE